jgi:hypothetical protein
MGTKAVPQPLKECANDRRQKRFWLVLTVLFWCVWHLPSQDMKPQSPTFRVDVDTVFVKVSVADLLGRYIIGLEKEHFRIFEDNVEQTISHFMQQSSPLSVGIVFDMSEHG